MTAAWICQWPAGHGNDSSCHDTEQQAMSAAREVVASQVAKVATWFRVEIEEAS